MPRVKQTARRQSNLAPVKEDVAESVASEAACSSSSMSASTSSQSTSTSSHHLSSSDYSLTHGIREDHKMPIYGATFNQHLSEVQSIFATVGGRSVTVYECEPNGALSLQQAYVDAAQDEEFYTCAWLIDQTDRFVLAAAGKRGLIHMLLPENGKYCGHLVGHGGAVNELATHPTLHNLVVSAGADCCLRMWNIDTQLQCLMIPNQADCGFRDEILSCQFNEVGDQIAACSMDHSVRIWKFDMDLLEQVSQKLIVVYDEVRNLRLPPQMLDQAFHMRDLHSNYVDCVRFWGDLIISKSSENAVMVWKPGSIESLDYEPGETNTYLLSELSIPDLDIWFVKFAIRGNTMYVGNKKGVVYIYDLMKLRPGTEMKPSSVMLKHKRCYSTVRQVAVSPNERHVIVVCDDQTVWRWDKKTPAIMNEK